MEFEELLHEEIGEEIQSLKNLEIGSETYKVTVDGVAKLMDRAIEMDKIRREGDLKELQFADERDGRGFDAGLREAQFGEDRKDRWIKNGLTAAGIVVPVIVTIWGTKKSFEFEKEGTVTTIMGRGFINKLLPKK